MRWRVIVKKEPLTGMEFGRPNSSNSLQQHDPKHPCKILHLRFALQGQTVDELNLLRRKKQLMWSSLAIFEIAVSLVLESFAPPILHSVVYISYYDFIFSLKIAFIAEAFS